MSGDFLLHRVGGPLDYGFDWDDGWLDDGETLFSSAWTIAPTGPTLSGSDNDDTTTKALVTATSDHAGKQYVLTNTITSSLGISDSRALVLGIVWP